MMVSKRQHTEGSASAAEEPEAPMAAASPSSGTPPKSNIKYAVDLEESDIEVQSDPKKAKGLEESWIEVPDVMEKPKST